MALWLGGPDEGSTPADTNSVISQTWRWAMQASMAPIVDDPGGNLCLNWRADYSMDATIGSNPLQVVYQHQNQLVTTFQQRYTFTYDPVLTRTMEENSDPGGGGSWTPGPPIMSVINQVRWNDATWLSAMRLDFRRPNVEHPTFQYPNTLQPEDYDQFGDMLLGAAEAFELLYSIFYRGPKFDRYQFQGAYPSYDGSNPDLPESITLNLGGGFTRVRFAFSYRELLRKDQTLVVVPFRVRLDFKNNLFENTDWVQVGVVDYGYNNDGCVISARRS